MTEDPEYDRHGGFPLFEPVDPGPGFGPFLASMRRLQDLAVSAAPDSDTWVDAAARVEELVKLLEPHQAAEGVGPAGRVTKLPGAGNLLMPAFTIGTFDPDGVELTVRFSRFHVGGNSAVHGGVLPLLFDSVFGMVIHAAGRPISRTAFLHVDYRSVTPIDETLSARGWIRSVEGRKAFVDHYLAVERGAVCGDTSELLSQFVAGDLKPKVALRMRAHLVRCSACRSLLHAERQADASLQALLPPAAVAATAGGGGWLHDHLLAPIGHAAGRLQPVADHLVGSKLGLVAASTLALAGSGVAVEHEIQQRQTDPPALRTALTADRKPPANAAPSAAATISLPAAVATAERRSDTIADSAKRKAAAQRRATARKKAAQAAANRGEFAPAGGEFSTATAKTAHAARSSSAATTASASAPAAEVPVTDTGSGASVDVATDAPSTSKPPSSTVSDEFGP